MEMEESNRREITDFLIQAKVTGHHWVAFEWSPGKDIHTFHGFESAGEAEQFCNDTNATFNTQEQDWEYADYRYMPVQTVQSAFEGNTPWHILAISLTSIRSQMNGQAADLLPGQQLEEFFPFLQSEGVFPVQWTKQIDPSANIERFYVIGHHHPGHQVYEIGHSTKIYDSFTSINQADEFLQILTAQDPRNQAQQDYLLVGQYRDQQLRINLEGWPENYSGITLKTAFYQYDPVLKEKSWQVSEVNLLSDPINIKHFLYARYDMSEGKLKLYDDRLQETKPEDLTVSTYPAHFSYEELTIKKSIIMEINMQNYDYLKNQVKYTGFGEALDQELKDKLGQQQPAFQIRHQSKFGQDEVNSTLNFEKSKNSELYFFNSYELSVKQPQSGDILKQTYFIGKENNITLKERYNMLNSRAVFKAFNKLEKVGEGEEARFKPTDETYKSWATLNFKETDAQGNFLMRKLFWDHEKMLAKFPVKELTDSYEKDRLVASLEKGNVQKATVVQNGQEIKVSIAANPLNKTFDFYDADMQRISVKQMQAQKLEIGNDLKHSGAGAIKQPVQKDEKHGTAEDIKQGKAEKRRQRIKYSDKYN
ncbi:MAG: hypothetical protein JWR38_3728 [Mucilaginibacter sp.]|nr:hypothetical protein [Mucilaginibacter sp.]